MKKYLLVFFSLLSALARASVPGTPVESYYASAVGKKDVALLLALHSRIDNHTPLSYSALEDYYPSTDMVNGYIWDMYSTCSFTMADGNKAQKKVCDAWNKEHSVPQSWFGEKAPMKSDLFHVIPTDARVNNFRGNEPYGETSSREKIDGSSHSLGYIGTSNFSGYSGKVFEPDDEYKGDFARIYMYMATRYSDSNLSMSNGSVMFAYNTSTASPKTTLTPYSVKLLMKWHRQDPVSQKEINRNDSVYRFQHNRNPFVDYPYLAEYIWGEKKGTAFSFDDVVSAYDDLFVPGESDGSRVITEPTLIPSVSSLILGPTLVGGIATQSLTVRGINLTEAISFSLNNSHFRVAPTSVSASSVNGLHTLTISYNPVSEGTETAILTMSSGTTSAMVQLTGYCSTSHTIEWRVSGSHYLNGDPDTQVVSGTAPQHLPLAPIGCEGYRVFVGWSAQSWLGEQDEAPYDLFAYENEAPVVTKNTVFYAVFAHEEGEQEQTDSVSFSSDVSSFVIGDLAQGVFSMAGGSNAPKYYSPSVRLYAKGTLTISSDMGIRSISFGTCTGSKTDNKFAVNIGNWSEVSHTWTGSADKVVFTVGGSSGHIKINDISVTTGGGITYSSFVTQQNCITSILPTETKSTSFVQKIMVNGQIRILRGDKVYSILGN